ncbi:MAG: amino acid ABC transporter permease [Nocardioidaceae bacterium]
MNGVPTLMDWTGNLWSGFQVTVLVTVLGALLMFALSFVLGMMARSHRLLVRGTARTVIEFFRGTSLLIQLFWLFFALPLLGLKLEPLFAGVLALGLNYGAYGAEVVRGSINAVDRAQWEAATALNLSRWHRMRRVIWPQAVVLMIPSMNNLFIQLLKSTPLLYSIAVVDLMNMGEFFRTQGGNVGAMYAVLLVIYFLLAYLFTFLFGLAEVRGKAKLGQHEGVGAALRELVSSRTPEPERVS